MKKIISVILCILTVFTFAFAVFAEKGEDKAKDEPKVGKVSGITQSAATTSSVTLKWNKVKNAQGYRVYQFDEKENKFNAIVKNTAEPQIEIKNLKVGTKYTFKVRAYIKDSENKNVWGEYCNEIIAVTSPDQVKSVVAADLELNNITLTWKSVSGASGYQVYIYDKENGKFVLKGQTDICNFTVENLDENTLYTFKVRAFAKGDTFKAAGAFSEIFMEFTHKNGLPVTNAQAAKVYNTAVNNAKNNKNMTVKHTKEIETAAVSCSKSSLFSTASNQMSLLDGKVSKTYKFVSGKAEGVALNSVIEPIGKDADVRGCDIKSFSASSKDGVLTLKLNLFSDKANYDGKTTALPNHDKRVLSTVKLQGIDTNPVIVKNAVQNYKGASITMKSKGGELTSLSIKSPVVVDANCKVSTLSFKASVSYTINNKYTVS
ncbi:MAG: fibronectin type III domain-containing protein [Faecalibacterium sp.]|nr:fibronectin type III domain-containing protein [Ruminococcus sp.]MCM1392461.1 fibronectin type III domain-containing protein [Ruminococcus sp.]MCM1486166.1 fibronectin type III domain-containing protein [Faecalibacterium sp.]